jgi:hypothetical protein
MGCSSGNAGSNHFIEMPHEVQDALDFEGRIDRSSRNIDWLLETA